MTTQVRVCCYESNDVLAGAVDPELVRQSLGEPTGAVPAYLDDDGIWRYVEPSQVTHVRRHLHLDVRTVYVLT